MLTIIALRVSLAVLVLWGIALFCGHQLPRGRKTWQAFLALGLLNNVIPFGLIVFGQQTIGAGLAAILNATTPYGPFLSRLCFWPMNGFQSKSSLAFCWGSLALS